MKSHNKKYAVAIISAILGVITVPTGIGPLIFGLLTIGFLIKGYEDQNGGRPWWSKSVVTLWRERKEQND